MVRGMTTTCGRQSLDVLRAHLDALPAAREVDPKYAPEYQNELREQAVTKLQTDTAARLDKLAAQVDAARHKAAAAVAELTTKDSAADLVRRGQTWERIAMLLDANPNPAVLIRDLIATPRDYLPTDDPTTVLRAVLEYGPAWATVSRSKPGMLDAAELVDLVQGALTEQDGAVGDAYRQQSAIEDDAGMVSAVQDAVAAINEGRQPNYPDLVRFHDADPALFDAVTAATGIPA